MDESRVTAMSQPFVVVFFEKGYNGVRVGAPVSTTYQRMGDAESEANTGNSSDTGNGSFAGDVALKSGIVSLVAQGIMPVNRTCTIKFIDPTLEITNQIMAISKWSNSIEGKGQPNIKIVFGWKYLKIIEGRDKNVSECSIHGMIMKTKFDINEYGITEIEIETLELGSMISSSATFIFPEDIQAWYNVKNGTNGATQITNANFFDTIAYKLDEKTGKKTGIIDHIDDGEFSKFLNGSSSLKETVGKTGSGRARVKFVFMSPPFTVPVSQGLTGAGTGIFNDVKIAFNESYEDFINDVLTKIPFTKHTGNLPDIQNGSYQIVRTEYNGDIGVNTIVYDWRKNIVNAEGEVIGPNLTGAGTGLIESFILRWGNESVEQGTGTGSGATSFATPDPYAYDANGYCPRASYKYLLNWSSDLNSKTYLHFMAMDKYKKLLTQYTVESMEKFQNELNNSGNTNNISPEFRPPFSMSEGKVAAGFSQAVQDALKDTSDNIKAQFAAIVSENVFKATATILGDPYIGHGIVPFKHRVRTDFNSTHFLEMFGISNSTNLRAFSKDWMLTKVTHKIDSGSFTTDLELLTAPNLSGTNPATADGAPSGSASSTSSGADKH